MPSANKTPNYGLNQWQANEYPKREDFVADNLGIDAALYGHVIDSITDSAGAHGLRIEMGVWTPYLFGTTTAGSNTYSTQSGRFTRINKRVIAECNIVLTAKDAAMSGNIRIGGLPFAAKDTINRLSFATLSNVPLPTSVFQAAGYVSGSFGVLAFMRNNLSTLAFTQAEINNTTSMTVVLEYEIN